VKLISYTVKTLKFKRLIRSYHHFEDCYLNTHMRKLGSWLKR